MARPPIDPYKQGFYPSRDFARLADAFGFLDATGVGKVPTSVIEAMNAAGTTEAEQLRAAIEALGTIRRRLVEQLDELEPSMRVLIERATSTDYGKGVATQLELSRAFNLSKGRLTDLRFNPLELPPPQNDD